MGVPSSSGARPAGESDLEPQTVWVEEIDDSIIWDAVDLLQSRKAGQVDEGSDLPSVSHHISTTVGLDQFFFDIPVKDAVLEGSTSCAADCGIVEGTRRKEVDLTPSNVVTPRFSDSPMCGGTTFTGSKCKHRALIGASFCKKHRPHDGEDVDSPGNNRGRKDEENLMRGEEGTSSTILVPAHQEAVQIMCKICAATLLDNQALGEHWMDSHKEEAQGLFRVYGCAVCLDSFTEKMDLEAHVQQKHGMQYIEECMLLQCIPCDCHFGNPNELWLHVLSLHPSSLSVSNAAL